MSIRNVKRWQWILVSLIVGAGFGYLQHLPTDNWRNAFGETMTQQQFEEGLVREHRGLKWFRNVVVYPEYLQDRDKRIRLLIVTGQYFDGRLQDQNGTRVAVWNPRCFIAEGAYEAITPNPRGKKWGTVMDYLRSIKDANFTYAWWRDPAWAIGLWTGGSFLIIGLIWPTLINLIAFGGVRRPREEKRIDSSKTSSKRSAFVPPKDADLEVAAKMAAELEAKIAADAAAPVATKAEEAATAPTLSASALELTASGKEQAAKEFGQEQDDFYPTERHAPHQSDT